MFKKGTMVTIEGNNLFFSDKHKNDKFHEAVRDIEDWPDRYGIEEVLSQTLPALARHLDGKALDDLKHAHSWLAVFEPRSVLGWEEAKSAFLHNGPACLDVLAGFTDLTRFEAQIGNMLIYDINFSTRLLAAIRDETERLVGRSLDPRHPRMVGPQMERWSKELADETPEAEETERVLGSRVEELLNKRSTAEEVYRSENVDFGSKIM